LYAWMLRNHFEIYEWDKTILHGKLTYVDNDWVSVGSYNINHLSDYASIETNVDVHDAAFSSTVRAELDDIIKNSTPVTSSDYHHKMNLFQQFTCWLSFHIVRILFGLQFALLAKE
ncbi:MAG TPA: phospholipase D-like domain-containing protein, partial [Bacteroidia bacterium]|nr:phospholipase D-like domain-containing protein [Bacteroidia bacterium]